MHNDQVIFATDPKAHIRYIKWLNDPTTREVLQIVKDEGVITMPNIALLKAEYALVAMGGNISWHQCIERIKNLHVPTQPTSKEPAPLFGATALMKAEYGKDAPKET